MKLGARIRKIRMFRNITQKELGRRLGYGESSADVRIAQYESGQRTPKQETLIQIAEILEVDVRNFLSPGIATMDELMETLFWMDEENRGLFHLFLLNDSESEMAGITIRDKKTMSYLQEWMGKKQKLGDGRITEEEYLDWKHASGRNVNADYLYGELEKRGIPAVIMEPLLGGRLSNVPDHIVARLKQQRPENSVASWAFRFAGSPDGVLTVLSGMTYMEHLQDNIRTYSPLIPVTDEEKDFLEETAQLMMKYPTIPCNDCKYCMPCPYALDIPGILLHYNKCVNGGYVPKSAQDENYAKARRAFLVGYDRSVPKLRQANHCTGCEQCNPHCPQGIDIPKEMQRIDKFVEELKVNG